MSSPIQLQATRRIPQEHSATILSTKFRGQVDPYHDVPGLNTTWITKLQSERHGYEEIPIGSPQQNSCSLGNRSLPPRSFPPHIARSRVASSCSPGTQYPIRSSPLSPGRRGRIYALEDAQESVPYSEDHFSSGNQGPVTPQAPHSYYADISSKSNA